MIPDDARGVSAVAAPAGPRSGTGDSRDKAADAAADVTGELELAASEASRAAEELEQRADRLGGPVPDLRC